MSNNASNETIRFIGIADQYFIAGRYLLRSGVSIPALSNLNQAFENIFKVLIWAHRKIVHQEDLSWLEVKKQYGGKSGHSLTELFKYVDDIHDFDFDDSWADQLLSIENNYSRRYPDNWNPFEESFDIRLIDYMYMYFRKRVSEVHPKENQEDISFIGTDLYNSFFVKGNHNEIIVKTGVISPWDMFTQDNINLDEFDIKKYKDK